MPKISNEDRRHYHEKIKTYKESIAAYLEYEQTALAALKSGREPSAVFKRLDLAGEMINLASNYIILSGVSQSMLKLRNAEALNDGRKSLYKAVIYLEEVVSDLVDAPYSEYEEKVKAIAALDHGRRYLLVRRMGLAIHLLEQACGENTKWRWNFVELEGRYSAVAKNILDLKHAVVNLDPRSRFYEPVTRHFLLVKKLLMRAANRYREKYELSTNRTDDFKTGIHFLAALRRLLLIMGESSEANNVKKKLNIWTSKLEIDIKKQEEMALKKIAANLENVRDKPVS